MITLTQQGNTLAVAGRLDATVVKQLWPEVATLVPADTSCLDLRQLSYSDSAGVAFLLELWQRAHSRGQSITLMSPSSQLGKLIALYDLEAFFVEEA